MRRSNLASAGSRSERLEQLVSVLVLEVIEHVDKKQNISRGHAA
jgi:hypothetical protein